MNEIPEDYRLFSTPATVITAENVEEYMSSAPVFDFSDVYFCKAD